ncbi:MAG: WG repeat-containing protein [Bacteroidia bacterium]|nr:WG repeat-containing protein [Bacteroidia bacterium]
MRRSLILILIIFSLGSAFSQLTPFRSGKNYGFLNEKKDTIKRAVFSVIHPFGKSGSYWGRVNKLWTVIYSNEKINSRDFYTEVVIAKNNRALVLRDSFRFELIDAVKGKIISEKSGFMDGEFAKKLHKQNNFQVCNYPDFTGWLLTSPDSTILLDSLLNIRKRFAIGNANVTELSPLFFEYTDSTETGIFDSTGLSILPPRYSFFNYSQNFKLICCNDGFRERVFDFNGKNIFSFDYLTIDVPDDFESCTTPPLFLIETKTSKDFYDAKGNKKDYKFDFEIKSFNSNYLIVKNIGNGKNGPRNVCGLIDWNGKQILDFTYEELAFYEKSGKFIFEKNEQEGLVDINGKILIPPKFEGIEEPLNDTLISLWQKNYFDALYDIKNHKEIFLDQSLFLEDSSWSVFIPPGYCIINNESDYGFAKLSGNILVPMKFESIEIAGKKLVIAKEKGKDIYWLYNLKGELIYKYKFRKEDDYFFTETFIYRYSDKVRNITLTVQLNGEYRIEEKKAGK